MLSYDNAGTTSTPALHINRHTQYTITNKLRVILKLIIKIQFFPIVKPNP